MLLIKNTVKSTVMSSEKVEPYTRVTHKSSQYIAEDEGNLVIVDLFFAVMM